MDKNAWDWDAITAISTAAAAVFTAFMAVFTAVMVWFTRKAILEGQSQRREANDHFAKTREQDKHHHEDGFRPLLLLTQPSNSPRNRSAALKVEGVSSITRQAIFRGGIRNIGPGTALNVRISVQIEGSEQRCRPCELEPIASGGLVMAHDGTFQFPLWFDPDFEVHNARLINEPEARWLLVLEYKDVFGNAFHTIHASDQEQPWTIVGRGKAPATTPYATETSEPAHKHPSVGDKLAPPM